MKSRQVSKCGLFAIGTLVLLFTIYCLLWFGSGFFTDMRTVENIEETDRIWNYVYTKQYNCSDKEYVGAKSGVDVDGAYYLCKDKKHWPYPSTSSDKCLVYSFGIDWDFKFDDAIAEMGCEVHAFDPSMDLDEGTKRESGVVFHKIGISEEDNDYGFKGWKMRTLKTLMKELGHENRVLDYLKVDTDKGDGSGFEGVVMHELINTGLYKCVRQYAMEIHMPGPLYNQKNMNRCKDLHNLMKNLNREGFQLYETVDNVRALQYHHPERNQMWVKENHFRGGSTSVLWESHFVNVNLKGNCKDYLQ